MCAFRRRFGMANLVISLMARHRNFPLLPTIARHPSAFPGPSAIRHQLAYDFLPHPSSMAPLLFRRGFLPAEGWRLRPAGARVFGRGVPRRNGSVEPVFRGEFSCSRIRQASSALAANRTSIQTIRGRRWPADIADKNNRRTARKFSSGATLILIPHVATSRRFTFPNPGGIRFAFWHSWQPGAVMDRGMSRRARLYFAKRRRLFRASLRRRAR